MEEATMDAQRPRSPADAPRRPPARPTRPQQDDDGRRTIATFPKSSAEEVRVSLSKFKGFDLVDARVWADPDDDGDRRPTRKGLCLRVERLPELLEALRKAEEEARKAGLLE